MKVAGLPSGAQCCSNTASTGKIVRVGKTIPAKKKKSYETISHMFTCSGKTGWVDFKLRIARFHLATDVVRSPPEEWHALKVRHLHTEQKRK